MVDSGFCMRNSVRIPAACRERFARMERPAFAAWRRAGIHFAGVSDLAPGYAIASRHPPHLMLIATAAGAGRAVTPEGRIELTPGTFYAHQPGAPVGWGIAGATWRIAWWYMEAGPRWAQWSPRAPCALLADLFDDLLARDGRLAEDSAGLLLHHLETLAAPARPEGRFAELWREVERHPEDDWSLEVLARRLGVSVSGAQRLARAHLGMPPHRAVVELRLARARELLRRTSYPVAAIAERVGYADPFTFSNAYRRWAGHPPSGERG